MELASDNIAPEAVFCSLLAIPGCARRSDMPFKPMELDLAAESAPSWHLRLVICMALPGKTSLEDLTAKQRDQKKVPSLVITGGWLCTVRSIYLV